ncbi:MAG TPA: tetratricopeptide repeat protein, partial [Burkholderiales bacterium]|nr:tetratricopeptide repeat protein [Burkholderiales bacterium]
MATYDLEEQEKLIQLKDWWKRHGGLVLTAITLGLLVIAGVRYWTQHKSNQAAEASVIYGEMLKAAESREAKKIADLSGTLLEQYPSTIYASLGALITAKVHFE